MKSKTYLILCLLLACNVGTGRCEMEVNTLIQLLNFSQTLIQNGELTCLLYDKTPVHPDEIGEEHQSSLARWEKQLIENPPKSKNPEAVRKRILGLIEREKKYGGFRDNVRHCAEVNLVFQILPPIAPSNENLPYSSQYAYRYSRKRLFNDFPSLEHARFYAAGSLEYWVSNGVETLDWITPYQHGNERYIGTLKHREKYQKHPELIILFYPPLYKLSDAVSYKVSLSEDDTGEPVYIITYIPYDKEKVIVYVRVKNGVPEVFKLERYYKSESPRADAEGYWLRVVKTYRDFKWVEALNIAYPRVCELQEFYREDGFTRWHLVAIIKEIDFNLELPMNFFDWDESDLVNDDGRTIIVETVHW